MSVTNNLRELGVMIPQVLLPGPTVDRNKWSVVACDQFTSEPRYWEELAAVVGEAPSTLRLIFPEVYLGKGDDMERIGRIHRAMRTYLADDILVEQGPAYIYVERQTAHGNLRRGLVMAVDLERYDYHPGSQTLIRATEGTVMERIPPRVKIRDGAALETPHIMLLIDDPEATVIEPVAAGKESLRQLYDFELLMGGGRLTGYRVADSATVAGIAAGLSRLSDQTAFNRKYGITGREVLLFAVGDGNHSLATAKAVWEKIKQETADPELLADHPARYALVEVVNIHDRGLQFEPIHRVLFGVKVEELPAALERFYQSRGAVCRISPAAELPTPQNGAQVIKLITESGGGAIEIINPPHNLAVGSLQLFIDEFLKSRPEAAVDYIHGEAAVRELGTRPGNAGFYLPPLAKSDLFKTVILDGVLPRKTFSMGEADEKRYYMECRRLSG